MKTLVGLAAAVALLSSGVFAADLGNHGGLKDDGFVGPINHADFSGFYVGIGAGGEFANTEFGPIDGIGSDGLVADIVAGYDFRFGSVVIGPRIQGGISNVNTTIGGQNLLNVDEFVNFGGRAGVVFNRSLLYAHGGYEVLFASSDSPYFDSILKKADLNAYTVGLGLETVVTDHVSLSVEGTYIYGIDDAEGTEAFRGMVRVNWRR